VSDPTQAAFDLDAYLRRTGAPRPQAPSLEALTALQQAHLAAIPFENLDVLLGKPIRLDLEALQAKLVAGRRGGYCFEQNTLFRAALEALGFRVVSLAARVRAGASELRPRTHMLLLVELPSGPFVADVGFGGDGPISPLPLREGASSDVGGLRQSLRREGTEWILEGHAGDLYAFTLEPQYPVDLAVANHFTSTWPLSPFVTNLIAQRCRIEQRAILRDRELAIRSLGREEKLAIRDPAHLLTVLETHFGLAFPPGTRFSRPEF
jgi:N-hydroxyarylamine O-acetyltransferase